MVVESWWLNDGGVNSSQRCWPLEVNDGGQWWWNPHVGSPPLSLQRPAVFIIWKPRGASRVILRAPQMCLGGWESRHWMWVPSKFYCHKLTSPIQVGHCQLDLGPVKVFRERSIASYCTCWSMSMVVCHCCFLVSLWETNLEVKNHPFHHLEVADCPCPSYFARGWYLDCWPMVSRSWGSQTDGLWLGLQAMKAIWNQPGLKQCWRAAIRWRCSPPSSLMKNCQVGHSSVGTPPSEETRSWYLVQWWSGERVAKKLVVWWQHVSPT